MTATSIDKALEVCEALSRAPRGASVGELARTLGLPAPTVHRLLAVLKRRGYVRQDEETQRYGLTLKMLDLSFQFLGRSELRLHAYPVLREYVLGSGLRAFIADPGGRRGHLRVGDRRRRSGDAHGLRQGDAGALRAVFLADAGDAAPGLSAARSRRATSPTAPPCCGGSGRRPWMARRRRWAARARRWWITRVAKWRGSAFSVTRRTRPRW